MEGQRPDVQMTERCQVCFDVVKSAQTDRRVCSKRIHKVNAQALVKVRQLEIGYLVRESSWSWLNKPALFVGIRREANRGQRCQDFYVSSVMKESAP